MKHHPLHLRPAPLPSRIDTLGIGSVAWLSSKLEHSLAAPIAYPQPRSCCLFVRPLHREPVHMPLHYGLLLYGLSLS